MKDAALNLTASIRNRTFLGVAGTLIIVTIVTLLGFRHLVMKSLPVEEGTIRLAGLSGPVEMYRDRLGIPHVFAANDADMYFAMGVAHAQDRLWQMDMRRRYAQGRLAEILGPAAAPVDQAMRILHLDALADTIASRLSPASRAMLDAYARGVNAWMQHSRHELPVEFDILQYAPEAWTPAHSILLWRAFAWDLTNEWSIKLLLADMLHAVGDARTWSVFSISRDMTTETAAVLASYLPDAAGDFERNLATVYSATGHARIPAASNVWAIGAQRSSSGSPLLAADIQLAHGIPGAACLIHMASPGVNVAGVCLPGIPAVIMGSNTKVAWSIAVQPSDNADLFLEHISYRDSTFEYRGSFLPLIVRTDSIRVKDAPPIVSSSFATLHGPVINPPFGKPDAAQLIAAQSSITLSWTGFDTGDDFLAFDALHHAPTVDAASVAVSGIVAPALAFLLAPRSGPCVIAQAGTRPVRSGMSGLVPVPGWDGQHEWAGRTPPPAALAVTDEDPRKLILAGGMSGDAAPTAIQTLVATDQRASAIADLIASQASFKLRDVQLMQLDIRTPGAEPLRSAMLQALDGMPNRPQELTDVRGLLASWDLSQSAFTTASIIYNITVQHLARETFEDEMGAGIYRRFQQHPALLLSTMARLLGDTTTTWFDNVATVGVETRDNILRKALVMTVRDLQRRFGVGMHTWQWGMIHSVRFTHPLGGHAVPGKPETPGPFPLGGSNETLNGASFAFDHPFEVVGGPVARFSIDMVRPEECAVILSTGVSGQPFSPHYSDMTAMWLSGIPHQLLLKPTMAREQRWPLLSLLPR